MASEDSSQTTVSLGRQLGPYKIEAVIGAGGMGQVFRAKDTRLHRTVAIKVLPKDNVTDAERKRRFLQEVQAASALNHPNIVTLHDIANDGGVDFIVMEYIAGKSLDRVITPKGLPLAQAIGYATQIAGALAAAHMAGIIHRDIKPANIIVTPNSQIKVLAFGLAKLLERPDEAATLTEAGAIVGTVAYMSPEQAAGRSLDHRTDIFSLGVVLYELIAGCRPFRRDSQAETMSAIMKDPYPPLTGVPSRIGEILDKALDKDPQERYQNAADFAVDLRRVQRAPAVTDVKDRREITAASPRRRSGLWIAAAIFLVAASALAIWFTRTQPAPANDLFANAQFTRLTDFPGDEYSAAISPDGKFVIFVSDRDGPSDVWLTQVGTGQFQNLTKGSYVAGSGARDGGFSADGSEIWLKGPPPPPDRMRTIPLVGGSWRPFLGDTTVNVAWTRDGSRIAYFNGIDGDPMFIADPDGANARQILIDRAGVHNHFPTWSLDEQWIYFTQGSVATGQMDLWRIASAGGQPERLTQNNRSIGYPTPLDARTILYTGEDHDGSGPWLWKLDVDRKIPSRIGFGLERYTSISASADGRRLVAAIANPIANLWIVPILDHPLEENEVKPYSLPSVRAVAPRFGGKNLFYLSSQGGRDGLWRLDDDGHATEVWKATQGALFQPAAISSDGRQAGIVVRKDAKQVLRLLTIDGSESRPLAESINVRGTGAWSPDGKWIVIGGIEGKEQGLFKIPLDGSAPIRLVTGDAMNPVWSPDGMLIAYSGTNSAGVEPLRAVSPTGTAIDLPQIRLSSGGERIRFTPDGKGLIYMQGGFRMQDFWLLDLATKKTRPLTHLNNPDVMRTFDVTPDGKQIVFDRRRDNSDVVLIDLPKTK